MVVDGEPQRRVAALHHAHRAGVRPRPCGEAERLLRAETLADTTVRVRVVYDGGFAVCRIPNPGQEAFDIEVVVEWITEDGSFDEGFHTYLRRNAGGFTDAWYLMMSAPPNGLDGSFDPACLDANGFGPGSR